MLCTQKFLFPDDNASPHVYAVLVSKLMKLGLQPNSCDVPLVSKFGSTELLPDANKKISSGKEILFKRGYNCVNECRLIERNQQTEQFATKCVSLNGEYSQKYKQFIPRKNILLFARFFQSTLVQ